MLNGDMLYADLYLIDKQLSGVDGLELCRHLKSQPSTAHIPIVMLSASPRIEPIVRNAGADAFIEKPFSKKDLLSLIRRYV